MKVIVTNGLLASKTNARLHVFPLSKVINTSRPLYGEKKYGAFFRGELIETALSASDLFEKLQKNHPCVSSTTMFLPEGKYGWILRYYAIGAEKEALFIPVAEKFGKKPHEIPMVHLPELSSLALPTEALINYFESEFTEFQ